MKPMTSCSRLLLVAALAALVAPAAPAAAEAPAAVEEGTPTFARDVAPIFQAKCEACHRADSIAPMSLVTYQEARPWARSIRERVATRQMPPWHIDRTVGITAFKNDRSLTDAEIDTIVRWVDEGAPRGNPADMPPPREWPDASKWYFAERFGGPPDLIVRSAPFTMPAEANDAWWKPVSETGLTEPRWVRAIELRPATVAGRRITHHAIARLQQEETDPLLRNADATDDDPLNNSGLFMEWAVGKQGELMRPGSGKLMLPESRIIWDVHYAAAGEEITDHVELGIYFYPRDEEPEHRQVLHLMGATGGGALDIPPHTVSVTEGFFPLRRAARIESYQPHMHLRGKAMSMEAILPTGRVRTLSHVGDFNFNWHNSYVYSDDVAPLLPRGTIIKVTAWHDNTATNRANPDPNVWVGYGDRTVDEMAHAWVNVTYLTDEDYEAETARRAAARTDDN
ncbi:MAG: hypothetical protein OXF93_22740 [Acidobacteria bacterium]|nr:hypothetical protein [Acidobacteriota bacterium]